MRQFIKTLAITLCCISTLVSAKQTIQYEDTFELEYAAAPEFSADGQRLLYQRKFMDKMTDSVSTQIWEIDMRSGQRAPLLTDVKGIRESSLSPDGKKLAYVASVADKSQIFIHYLSADRSVAVTQLDDTPRRLLWSPDGQYLSFLKHEDTPATTIFKEMPKAPKGAKWAKSAKIIDRTRYRDDGRGYRKPGYSGIFRIPASGGIAEQLSPKDIHFADTLSYSPDGKQLYASRNLSQNPDLNPVANDIVVYDFSTQTWSKMTSLKGSEYSPKISPDGQWLAYLYVEDEKLSYQFPELHIKKLDTGETRSLTQSLDRRVAKHMWSADSQSVVFSYLDSGKTRVAKSNLSGDMIGMPVELSGQTLGRPYTSGDFALASSGNLAYTYSPATHPAELMLLDTDNKISRLTNLNSDWLKQREVANVHSIEIKSSIDQRPIQAWVATPPNFNPEQQYPLILEIHGGPHAAYGPHFSMEIQLMAANGYVVVWANPRGSSSYGSEFGNLIHHNYPSNDYQDLMDVVDEVASNSYIDNDNLFITGGSGGGVLTAWSIGKTNRFKAAVVAKPVINWVSFALTADAYPVYTQYWMKSMPWEHADELWQRSPLSLVGNVETPTMLLTGEADYRTPIGETEQYYQALRLRQIDTVMVRIPGASHGIASRPSRLIQKAGHIVSWFDKYRVTF